MVPNPNDRQKDLTAGCFTNVRQITCSGEEGAVPAMNLSTSVKFIAILVGCYASVSLAPAQISSREPTVSEQSKTDTAWRLLTSADVDAAYRLLKENHPAATPEANDPAFVAALDRAHIQALVRAKRVRTMDGYTATLREFANAMGDGHISSSAQFSNDIFYWAGIIAAKRGDKWFVANEDKDVVGAELSGAEIVSCDGEPIADVARRVMRFRVVAGSDAGQVMRGGRLLLDDGNPFLRRPWSCSFNHAGATESIKLNWQKTSRPALDKSYWKPAYGAAGLGVRRVGSGYWIGLESLDPAADAVIDEVKKSEEAIRSASFVVVDVRGNVGGNDLYGRKLANALYGPAYVDAKLGSVSEGCPSVFRASPSNITAVGEQIKDFEKAGDADGASMYRAALDSMRRAQASGRNLTATATCPVAGKRTASEQSPMVAPVVILTDVVCFSSCINTVSNFRELGAVQAGQITGEDTHYSEVRSIMLPSGLSWFGTLMALMPDAPARIGPFKPALSYDGDIADTAALEAWLPRHISGAP